MPSTMPIRNDGFKLTAAALNDLREIARYTQNKWGKNKRSVYLRALDERFNWLAQNPDLGLPRDDIKTGYLCYPEGKHIIFYRKNDDWIDVLGILHQSMDFKVTPLAST